MKYLFALLLALLGAGCATAPIGAPPPPSLAVPRVATAPVIDGRLDDPCWQSAALIAELHPFLGEDHHARMAQIPTRIRLAWAPEALYIAYTCTDDEIYLHDRVGGPTGSLHMGDVAELFIDPLGHGTLWFELQVSPQAETFAQLYVMVNGTGADPVTGRVDAAHAGSMLRFAQGFELRNLTVASGRIPGGWCVEIAIPAWNFVRYENGKLLHPMTIRANLARYDWERVPGKPDRQLLGMLWSPVESGCPHISPARMGDLRLLP